MSNSNVPYSGIEGGLRDDYEPESVGQATLSAGSDEAEGQWEEYGLEMPAVHLNGEDTGRRFVLRNGEFIADVSDRYKLLPNEEAVEAADAVAEELGAVPFNEFDGDWYIPLEDHAFQDEEGRRVHALYAWDDPVDLARAGEESDEVQFGFAVHNSIDSSLAFQVGLFTFRKPLSFATP